MALLKTAFCADLPLVPEKTRQKILDAPRDAASHSTFMTEIEAMHRVERGGEAVAQVSTDATLTIAAWNLERCLDPEGSAALLMEQQADIVLLSEMDCGMARTGQRHTTREVARSLGMEYAYGVEFFELGLGSPVEVQFASDCFNASGWHGNAVLSKYPMTDVALIRLDDHGQWFCGLDGADSGQPRIGGRMAIAVRIETASGPFCTVSTHLESTGEGWWRLAQMERLISAIDTFAPGIPVVIGGDLNTGNNMPDGDWRQEMLFAAAERRGFSWANNADGLTTRQSRISSYPKAKLDWFAHRDCVGKSARIISALDPNDVPLSDHELIVGQFALLS